LPAAERATGPARSAGPDLAAVAAAFGHLLHAAGVPVTPERSGRFARVLDLAGVATEVELYWAARVTLLSDVAQLDAFDRVFRQVFGGIVDLADARGDSAAPPPAHTRPGEQRHDRAGDHRQGAPGSMPTPTAAAAGDSVGDEGRDTVLAAVSDEERLRTTSFAALSADELATMRQLLRRMVLAPPKRPSRRTARHRHGRTLDVRATVRRAHRTGGDPVAQVFRRRSTRRRRLVFLCDVSGSMEATSRAYLLLLHCAVGGSRAEAFVFATRLTRITRALRGSHPDLAMHRAALAAPDWSGGPSRR
jgi:uncharacterized protein with von Willebrand factor type A (vWA) domain